MCGVNERCKLAARYSLVLIISFVYKVEFVQFVLFKLTTLLYTRYYVYLIMIMGDLYWYIKCKKDALSFKGSAVQHFALEFAEFVQLFISINLFKSIDWIFEKFEQVVLPHSSALEQLLDVFVQCTSASITVQSNSPWIENYHELEYVPCHSLSENDKFSLNVTIFV